MGVVVSVGSVWRGGVMGRSYGAGMVWVVGDDEWPGRAGRVDDGYRDVYSRFVFWQMIAVEWPGPELQAVSDWPTPPPDGGWPEVQVPSTAASLMPVALPEPAPDAPPAPRQRRARRWWDPATWD